MSRGLADAPLRRARRTVRAVPTAIGHWLVSVLFLAGLPGCAFLCQQMTFWPLCPPPCTLPARMPLEQLVEHLNGHVVSSWRSNDVTIRAHGPGGLPVSLSAFLAVEQPRNVRLVANNSFGGREVDLGSNRDRFWFWLQRAQPRRVVTAAHDDAGRVRIPFEPDWLMEALGVRPLRAEELTVQHDQPAPHRATLLAERLSPGGQRMRHAIVVDTCYGLILQHALFDASGRHVARAVFSDHRPLAGSGVTLPHRIELHWPEAELALTMYLGHVEIKPPATSDDLWTLPSYPDSPIEDLSR